MSPDKIAELQAVLKGLKPLLSGDFYNNLTYTLEGSASLFKFHKFQIGDRVRLIVTPKIDRDSGWWCCRHFLIAGATAVIHKVEFLKGKFRYDLLIDNQTWIDLKGEQQPSERLAVFGFWEGTIEKATDQLRVVNVFEGEGI